MYLKTTLAASVGALALLLAAPQSASALPQASGIKEINKSNVEQAYYRGRRGYYRNRGYYGHRHYRRRPGFGIFLGL